MAHLYGYFREGGETASFHPLAAEKQLDGSYVLRTGRAGASPKHYNGDATLLSATINFSALTKHIYIENMDAAESLYISFDGGTNWKTIKKEVIFEFAAAVNSMDIKATAADTPYEIITLE